MRPIQIAPALAAGLASAFLAPTGGAQSSLLTFHGQVIATTGDAVPGLTNGEIFGGSSTFGSAVISDDGKALFRGRFTGPTVTSIDDRAYFWGDSRSGLELIIRGGDAEPSGTIPGATLNGSFSGLSSSPRIAGDGTIMFGTILDDGGFTINSSNDSAIYVGTPGNFQLLVREGDPAVGTVGATYDSSFSSPSQQLTSVNNTGISLFKTDLAGGDVISSTNDEAWYMGAPGNLVQTIRKGDTAPGGEVIADISPGFVAQTNAVLQVIYDVSFVGGTGTPPVTTANDRALWLYSFATNTHTQIVREGDATPIPGVTYNRPSTDTWSINTGASTFNALGRTLIRSDLGGAVIPDVDDSAIFIVGPGLHTLVVRRGDAAPDIPGATLEVFNNTSLQFNDAQQVAFQSTIGGAGVTDSDDTGIWAGTVGDLQLVVREGDVAPGTGGSTFGGTTGQSMLMNGKGQLLFNNTLVGGGSPGSSLWSWDPVAGLAPALLSGDMIEVQPGNVLGATSQGGVQFNNGRSRPLSFHDDGNFSVRVNFPSSVSAIMNAHVGSLFATPREVSTSTGGTQSLFLNAGPANAGLTYLVAGSVSGTTPGIAVGSTLIPLNPDVYFTLTIEFANTPAYMNTLGTLDGDGRATAAINIPPGIPGIAGLTLNHAFMGFNAFGALKYASEPTSLVLIP